jgi:hypothetical protein
MITNIFKTRITAIYNCNIQADAEIRRKKITSGATSNLVLIAEAT